MNRIPSILCLALIAAITGCAAQNQSIPDPTATAPEPNKNISAPAAASNPLIQTGRYSAITAAATEAQINPLRVMIQVTMPREVATVRQAIEYLLRRSGYRLSEPDAELADIAELFRLPLPQVHRQLGPMPLDEALRVLAGPAFELSTDPLHRTVSYELKERYTEPKYTVEVVHE